MLDYENSVNPYDERKSAIAKWRTIAKLDIDFSEDVNETGRKFMKMGLKNKDALHLACAFPDN